MPALDMSIPPIPDIPDMSILAICFFSVNTTATEEHVYEVQTV